MADEVQDFPAMLKAVLGDRLTADASSFVDMLAPDVVMEFPFAPPGLPARLEGSTGVARYLGKLARLITFDSIGPGTLLAVDSDVAVVAFEASGQGVATGATYKQRYLSVIETRGGQIVRYLDYWDPLAVLRALLGEKAVSGLKLSEVYDG